MKKAYFQPVVVVLTNKKLDKVYYRESISSDCPSECFDKNKNKKSIGNNLRGS